MMAVLRWALRAVRGGALALVIVATLAFAAGSALTVLSAGLFAGVSALAARAGLAVPGPMVRHRGAAKPLREAVADTTRRVAARTARGIPRGLAGTVGQAVPFLGAATVVGVTAWELSDSCGTLRDLGTLDAALGLGEVEIPLVCRMLSEMPDKAAAEAP